MSGLRAGIAVGVLSTLVGAGAAFAGPPGSTVMLTRPAGFGPLTAPSVNDSTSSGLEFESLAGGGIAPSRRTVGGPSHSNRYVVFVSAADGMAPDDDDRVENVYVRDLETNATTL